MLRFFFIGDLGFFITLLEEVFGGDFFLKLVLLLSLGGEEPVGFLGLVLLAFGDESSINVLKVLSGTFFGDVAS